MIKIFSFLSMVFALLAGFSACGTSDPDIKSNGGKHIEEEPDYVTDYGGQYVEFVVELSGTVKNRDEEVLEGIKIDHFNSGTNTESDKKGDFDLNFSEGGSSLSDSVDVCLNLSDKTGVYEDKSKCIYIDCGEGRSVCKKEDIEIIMKKIGDEEPDEYENPDTETDDQSTDEE